MKNLKYMSVSTFHKFTLQARLDSSMHIILLYSWLSILSLRSLNNCYQAFFNVSVLSDKEKLLSEVAVPESQQKNFSADDFSNYIRSIVATKEQFGCQAEKFQRQLIEFYAHRDVPEDADSSFYLSRLDDVSYSILMLGLVT